MNINCPFSFQTLQVENDGGRPGDALSIVDSVLSIFPYFYMYATCVKPRGHSYVMHHLIPAVTLGGSVVPTLQMSKQRLR